MSTTELPSYIVLSDPYLDSNPYVYCKEDGSTGAGADSVFSPLVKIAVEKSTVNSKYVHLRFCNNNKYWQSNEAYNIVAESNQPIEDTTNPLCTLFEPALPYQGELTLTHVHTGWPVGLNTSNNNLFVNEQAVYKILMLVDWQTLVNLPTNIALKGDNGKYLNAYDYTGWRLQFSSDDPNQTASGHTVALMPTGQVQIRSKYFNELWWMAASDANWIYSDWNSSKGIEFTSYFWPVKIDDITIALRNADNNLFCQRLSMDGISDCLAASTDTIVTAARLQVQELVAQRKIYNVTYAMEDSLIYDEAPYLAGTATLTNPTDQEASMDVSITYQDEKSYTFSRGVSLSAGVSITMEAGIPLIFEENIQISFEINGSLDWDTTTTVTTSVTATGTVPVPANSTVSVSYVGTQGTCNIPYTYTQEDISSTTGEITYYNQTDGTYNGVSCYNFDFQVSSPQST